MEEGKRQRQVAGAIQEEMNDIFRRLNLSMIAGGMVSISSVKVTPVPSCVISTAGADLPSSADGKASGSSR